MADLCGYRSESIFQADHILTRLNLKAQDMFGDFLQLLEDGEPVEEGVLEGLLEGDPPVGVVVEHPGDQVQHHRLLLTLPGGWTMPSENKEISRTFPKTF